ncbi:MULTISPECIES: error-prone DNA polymerase [unclassified Beijerinckia]|uniref:error-prone DNA polymerase n=1 Tax=unclassified Beijerinckia TaxID=2638183 RepID=UPI00089787D8|nr:MULTISPECIES: error-prone DNA polymerase [unclassified Beijerinckia]MDH7797749.1 error-prone DNA polymerase [Beijerinckia sp. GAS462]SEC97298.1 error-prone DNA polymerase, DnaE-like [Beijerinckia sp. 28-YEA-48]
MTRYADFATASNFSFLRGASHARDLVAQALGLGHAGLGIADRNTVAGVVRAYAALNHLRKTGTLPATPEREGSGPGEYVLVEHPTPIVLKTEEIQVLAEAFKLVVGARLAFMDGTPDILVYPEDRAGWGRLCRLLTVGNRRAKKGECDLTLDDLLVDTSHLLLVVMPERQLDGLAELLTRLDDAAPGAVWLAATMHRRGDDRRRLSRLIDLARRTHVPLLATNDVLYHAPEQRDLQDVMTCIREGETLESIGRRLEVNAERHFKEPKEMARLFKDAPAAIDETGNFLDRISFSLDQLRYEYPDEPIPPGWTPQDWLEDLVHKHGLMRYPDGMPEKVQELVKNELTLIRKLDYARYFLTIHDIVRFANDNRILCQGRGSAANSAVCYILGITAVDPDKHKLLLARFLSENRGEPPDIDVDFEHERREEVIQYVYEKYGRHRAGIAATVISYRSRSAIRDVGKALGLTEDVTAKLSSTIWGSWGGPIRDSQIKEAGLDPSNPLIRRAVDLAIRLLGFPRHLSQHVGGFVMSRGRLDEIVPIGNAAMDDRTFIEWDKDDIDEIGLMKVDVLALGMLTCIRKAFDLMRDHYSFDTTLADVPSEKEDVYDMLCDGESLGVFQVESRAQMNMLPRLKPRKFYDLVIQVAIVRPGPIQGDMVHPYLRRRNGEEAVVFPAPKSPHDPNELIGVLGRTLGVPLFQEQAMDLAMVAAEFTPDEANGLRKAMATFRHNGTIQNFEKLMVGRMIMRGYDPDFAQRCFNQIKGFGEYGFPESHAASFAKLVYVSSFIKCRFPAAFACALLNSQPMGFYAPAQIISDAQKNKVEVREVDVNHSAWDNTLEGEGTPALRIGFRQISGMCEEQAKRITDNRSKPFTSVEEFAARTALPNSVLRCLADADAFRSMHLDRRAALWAVRRLPDDAPLPLFLAADARELGHDAQAHLPQMRLGEHIAADYQTIHLSLKGHPMQILREVFARERAIRCGDLVNCKDGAWVRVAGVVLVRQRPGKGNAIFITLEDETGVANLVLWARTFERFRKETMGARLLLAEGRVQKSPEGVIHLMTERLIDRTVDLNRLSEDHETKPVLSPADEFVHPQPLRRPHHPRNVRIIPKSRDFH